MRRMIYIALTGILAIAMIGGASATETETKSGTASVNVTSDGVLSVTIDNASFDSVPYKFTDQSTTASIKVNVEDNRGNGTGWKVSLYGSDFQREDGTKFDIDHLALASAEVERTAGQIPTEINTHVVALGDESPGQVIASAPELQGMGHYTVDYSASLTVPGGTLVGEYKSTLYVSITSEP